MINNEETEVLRGGEILPSGDKEPQDTAPTKEDLPTVAPEEPPLLPASANELIVAPKSAELASVANDSSALSVAPKNELVPVVPEEPPKEAQAKEEAPPTEEPKATEEPKREEPQKEEPKPRPKRPAQTETALTAIALVVITTVAAWALARPKTLLFPPTKESAAPSGFAPDCKRVRFDVASLLGERWKPTISSCLRGSCDGLRESLLTRNFSVANWRLLEEGDQGEGCLVTSKGATSSPECTRILGRVEGGAKTLLLQVEGECREAP